MRSKKFSKMKRKQRESLDVDITSLLDILVILLVFLLKSYNASDLKLQLVDDLKLPISQSNVMGEHTVQIQVNKNKKIWVDNKEIGQYKISDGKILALFDKLQNIKKTTEKEILELEGRSPSSNPQIKNVIAVKKRMVKKVNLVIDQDLPYQVLRNIMHTSSLAGYGEFKFIIQGKSD